MNLLFHIRHLHLQDAQKEMISQKVEKLSHLADRLRDESCEFRLDLVHHDTRAVEDSYEARLTIFAPGETLHVEAYTETLENSVDAMIEKMKKQIEHYKAKLHHA